MAEGDVSRVAAGPGFRWRVVCRRTVYQTGRWDLTGDVANGFSMLHGCWHGVVSDRLTRGRLGKSSGQTTAPVLTGSSSECKGWWASLGWAGGAREQRRQRAKGVAVGIGQGRAGEAGLQARNRHRECVMASLCDAMFRARCNGSMG